MKARVLVCLMILIGVACSRSYEVYSSKYPVSFSCDISKSPFNKVQTPGHFLSVRLTPTKESYKVTEPGGGEQTLPLTEMQKRVFNFGLAGLIIGRPYFGDGEYYAYDLGCPECDTPSARLIVSTEGTANCSKCSTIYDLNNGGVAKTGDSRPLYRYRTSLNDHMLMVHN